MFLTGSLGVSLTGERWKEMETATKKKTAKQLAKWAVEDAMNRMMDTPFYRGSDEEKQYSASSDKFQAEVIRHCKKYADRILKNVGSDDRYSEEA